RLLLVQVQLALPVVVHLALLVDEEDRRPVAYAPLLPDRQVVVDDDRELQPVRFGLCLDALDVHLRLELRTVHADDRELCVLVLVVPALVARVVVLAVDAAEGPEVHDDDAAAQIGEALRLALQPLRFLRELGRRDRLLATRAEGQRERHARNYEDARVHSATSHSRSTPSSLALA